MSRIVCVMSVFNDARVFEESIRSARAVADYVVVADGAYREFPHDSPTSDDGTLELAYRYADVVITCGEEPWEGEAAKRNALLDEVREGDWILRLDADEIVESFDRSCLDTSADALRVRLKYYSEDLSFDVRTIPALFRKQRGLEYKFRDGLYIGDESITNCAVKDVDGIVLGHHQYDRTDERKRKRAAYRELRSYDQTVT